MIARSCSIETSLSLRGSVEVIRLQAEGGPVRRRAHVEFRCDEEGQRQHQSDGELAVAARDGWCSTPRHEAFDEERCGLCVSLAPDALQKSLAAFAQPALRAG